MIIPEKITTRLISLMFIYHLMHDKTGNIRKCNIRMCKQNMMLLRKYHLEGILDGFRPEV